MIDAAGTADTEGRLPQGLLESDESEAKPRLIKAKKKDEPIFFDEVELPESKIVRLFRAWRMEKE